MTWTYHTAERMGWSRWTRKRKLKFKKRYFKQHGRRFGWFMTEFKHIPISCDVSRVILFQRETGTIAVADITTPSEPSSASSRSHP